MAATPSIWSCGCGAGWAGEEHAQGYEEVGDYLGVGCQHVCEQDVAEFPCVGGREAPDGDPPEGREEAGSSRRGEASEGQEEEREEEHEVGDWEVVVVDY